MFNKKKEAIPEGMIETKDLFLCKIGEVWESRTPTGYKLNIREESSILILKRNIIDSDPKKTKFTDIFTGTTYTYRNNLSVITVTRIKPLPSTTKYLSLETLEKLYNEVNTDKINDENKSKNKKKSKLRQRRYID